MAQGALFIGWGEAARGRERQALQLFGEVTQYYAQLQQRGEIESFEPVILEPHGGDLGGFLLLKGEQDALSRLRVSEEFLRPLPDGAALRASLGIAPDEQVVGLVSTLVAHEGIGTLLDAVKVLNDRGVKARALIVGDGPERTALQRHAAALGLNAIFTGRVPSARVRDYHAVLDVFVVPRTPDRVCQLVTPLKPVEAMASGLPVVVSAVNALSEIIADRETGMLAPPLDPGGLADRLQQLLSSPDLRAKLGASAREWVARDRTWAHNAVRYREAYQRLGVM